MRYKKVAVWGAKQLLGSLVQRELPTKSGEGLFETYKIFSPSPRQPTANGIDWKIKHRAKECSTEQFR